MADMLDRTLHLSLCRTLLQVLAHYLSSKLFKHNAALHECAAPRGAPATLEPGDAQATRRRQPTCTR
jgi:hypothetical protein